LRPKPIKYLLRFALLVLLLAGERSVFGQPCFTFVGDSTGCAPFKVTVFSCTPQVDYSLNFKLNQGGDYETPPKGVKEVAFTYDMPGKYVIGQIDGSGPTFTRIVRVFDISTKPAYSWKTCQDTLILLFEDTVFSAYRFQPGDGSVTDVLVSKTSGLFKYKYNFPGSTASFTFSLKGNTPSSCNQDLVTGKATFYKTNQAPISDSLIGIDTLNFRASIQTRADEPYVFQFQNELPWLNILAGQTNENSINLKIDVALPNNRQKANARIATLNGCGALIDAPFYTLIWPILKTDNQKITISWPKVQVNNLTQFDVLRNGIKILDALNFADTSFTDSSNLVCGLNYCYKFIMKRQVPGYSDLMYYQSPEICGQAISNRPPDPVRNLTTNVTDSGIVLIGIGSKFAKTYEVYRKEMNEDSFTKISETEQLPIFDKTADYMNRAYCYKISFKDICGNQALFTDTICPIWLRVDLPNESEKNFVWTDLFGWKDGVDHYEFIRFTNDEPPSITEVGSSKSRFIKGRDPIRQRVRYKVRAIAKNLTLYPDPSYSNPVWIIQKPKLRFPDVFTPNQDNVNDDFKCYSLFISNFEMKVFNAWGAQIFYSDKIEKGWDGNIDSKPAQGGPYAYWAKGKDEEGEEIEVRGYFTLAR